MKMNTVIFSLTGLLLVVGTVVMLQSWARIEDWIQPPRLPWAGFTYRLPRSVSQISLHSVFRRLGIVRFLPVVVAGPE